MENIIFSYEKTAVLKNISLSIKAGEVVAFVGMSGGGKTFFLVNLIPRFYDVSAGRILIDGNDIRMSPWNRCAARLPSSRSRRSSLTIP